jgi:methylated-DNA-[protein]-cysteine S-methyltransferase
VRPERYRFDSPLGPMIAEWTPRGLSRLRFASDREARSLPSAKKASTPSRRGLHAQLQRFFTRSQWEFDVPLDLSGGTDFDRAVWRTLTRIECGRVRTYGEVARSIGKPLAARAVGNACGRNPVPVVIPCHRVVAANDIGGFGLGLGMKRKLLALEGTHV